MTKEFRRRIGVFGGTFDPPHFGHISSALFAMRELNLDFELMLVANDPWQKTDPSLILSENKDFVPSLALHRYEMLKKAVKEYEGLVADDMEIIRGGKTYTIDTLEQLQDRFPKSEFFLMIGTDVARDFHTWRDPQKVCRLSNVVVLNRPGVTPNEIDESWNFPILQVPAIDVSAEEIRNLVVTGKNLESLLAPEVEQYIHSNGLYRSAVDG